MFFTEDGHWNAERQAAVFGVEIGACRGVIRAAALSPAPPVRAANQHGCIEGSGPRFEPPGPEAIPAAPIER